MKSTSLFLAGAAAMALAGSAASARSGLATRYGPMSLFGGYSDKMIEPGVWRVSARSNGPAGAGFGESMAAYRAAEILSAHGFPFIQLLDARGDATVLGRRGDLFQRRLNEHVVLIVRGAYSSAAPADCRAKDPTACITVSTADLMARMRQQLHIGE